MGEINVVSGKLSAEEVTYKRQRLSERSVADPLLVASKYLAPRCI